MLNPWIVKTIKLAAQTELKDQDEERLNNLWDLIHNAFQIWKIAHGERKPKIINGLLDYEREIAFEDAEPWQCAGLVFASRLNLALMLIGQDDPDFMTLINSAKLNIVLALLIDRETDSDNSDDLFFAYDILIKSQSTKLGVISTLRANWDQIVAGEKQIKNLAKGNPAAAKNKSIKATKYHELWKTWAMETWNANPYFSVEKVAEHVLNIATDKGHEMANKKPYQVNTIIKIITGVRQSLKAKS